jgi:hypothetical protein
LKTVLPLVEGDLDTHVEAVLFDVLDNVLRDLFKPFRLLDEEAGEDDIYGLLLLL